MKKAITVSLFVIVFGIVLNVLNPDFSPIKRAITSVIDSSATQKITQLEEKISILNQKTAKLEPLERENKKLKTLLDIETSKEYKKIYVNVLSLSVADEIFITIDKGAKSNIKSGDVAVFGANLIGRVTKVYDMRAHIVPITAPKNSVGACVLRTGSFGYTESSRQDFFENKLSLTLFGAQDFAAGGDKITTSGLGSVFPEGLIIGSVIESNSKDQPAIVRTATDFFSLDTLCVLTEVGK